MAGNRTANGETPRPHCPQEWWCLARAENAKVGGRTQQTPKGAAFWLGCWAAGLEMGESLAAKLERLPVKGKHADVAAWSPDAADHGDWYALRLCFGLEGGST